MEFETNLQTDFFIILEYVREVIFKLHEMKVAKL